MLLAVVAAVAMHLGEAADSQAQPRTSSLQTFHLTDPRSSECALWTAVEQLARQARLRIGFEATRRCSPGMKAVRAGAIAVTFEKVSPLDALDALLQLSPEFSWSEIEGIVVVRPKKAWTDADDPLNQTVGQFSLVVTHPHIAVHEALKAAIPPLFMDHTDLEANAIGGQAPDGVAVQFDGGHLVDALNTIIKEFEGIWQVGYTSNAFHVVFHSFEFESGSIIPGRLTTMRK